MNCLQILTTGFRKGQKCGRKCVLGKGSCNYHLLSSRKLGLIKKEIPRTKLVIRKAGNKEIDRCAICLKLNLKNKGKKINELDCGHIFHLKCLVQLDTFNCPLCRRVMKYPSKVLKSAINKNIRNKESIKMLEENKELLLDKISEMGDTIYNLKTAFLNLDQSSQNSDNDEVGGEDEIEGGEDYDSVVDISGNEVNNTGFTALNSVINDINTAVNTVNTVSDNNYYYQTHTIS